MRLKRILIIVMLLTGLSFSILILTKSLLKNDLNTSASCLAVITAIIASWTALTITWNQENAILPMIELRFDLQGRFGLIQLVVENVGKSQAYDISIKWDKPIKDSNGKIIDFPTIINSDKQQFLVLMPNEKVTILIDEESHFFEKYKNTELNYTAVVSYKTSTKALFYERKDILLSLDHVRKSLSYDSEEPKTLYELQRIPNILEDIKNILAKELKTLKNNPNS